MNSKQQEIFKELKRRMNYLQDELGYEVLFIALQGSQNYGMDIYTEEYKSDLDCMAVVLPSFDDFVSNKQAVSTTYVLPSNEHINVKDIRLMFELFYKQNPQFLELLFTDYKIVNKKYKLEVQPLFANADKIASYNLLKLYNGISGMAQEKLKALEHPYPSIKDVIDKYGYCYTADTKFLTNTGWKYYYDIRDDEYIGTMNPITFNLEFQKFSNRYKYKCKEGYIYDINTRNSRFKITENHNVFSSKVSNINCNGRNYNENLSNWNIEPIGQCIKKDFNRHIIAFPFNYNEDYKIDDLKLWLYGSYISEGTVLFRNKNKQDIKEIRVSQYKDNTLFRDNLDKCIKVFNGNKYCYKRKGGKVETLWCFNKEIAQEIYDECGYYSDKIHLPSFIYKLSTRQCNILLSALLLGDGTDKIQIENRYVYYTTSEKLADDMVSLAFLSGYTANRQVAYKHNKCNHYGDKPVIQVMIKLNKNKPFVANFSLNNIKNSNIKKVQYNGDVVCFTVPNGLLVTMNSGKVAVQPNCGKQLHHIIRLYQFITNLTGGLTFKQSLTHFEPDIRYMCMEAKLNEFGLEEARDLARVYSEKIHTMKEEYFEKNEVEIKDEVVEILLDIKLNILRKFFKEDLLPDYKEPFKLCPDQYKKVWVTSDTHFGHNNILSYENRVEKLKVSTVEEHDKELINRWNAIVGKDDLVLILGDFSFKKADRTEEVLNKLNGDKVLIRGNHDIFLDDKKFNKSLFKAIYDYKETKYKGQEIALMHYPIQDFKHQNKETKPAILLFGHIHTFNMEIPKHSFNVGVDVNNYYPVDLTAAIAKALNNNGGLMNGKQ